MVDLPIFGENIMHNKNILLALLCLGLMHSSSASFVEKYLLPGIIYFDFGFDLGVKPYMWPFIPYYALGNGLKYIPQQNKATAYILGTTGCLTGTMIVCSAIAYGIKKLSSLTTTNDKDINLDIQHIKSLTIEQNISKSSQTSNPKCPYTRNYNHSE